MYFKEIKFYSKKNKFKTLYHKVWKIKLKTNIDFISPTAQNKYEKNPRHMGSELIFVQGIAWARTRAIAWTYTGKKLLQGFYIWQWHLLSYVAPKPFWPKTPEIFATSIAWLGFKKHCFDWKALNNKREAQDLTGSDSECSESGSECREAPLAWHVGIGIHTHIWLLAVIYKERLRIVLKLYPQMHAGALVFSHSPPPSFPCIPFSVFLCCEYSSFTTSAAFFSLFAAI